MTSLTTNNLCITRQQRRLCQNLSIEVKVGDFWGILGPNGSGKTTLLHTLCGLIPYASGDILVAQQPLRHLKPRELAQQIGILLQGNMHPFPQSVHDYCLDARFPHHTLLAPNHHREADNRLLQHILQTFHLSALAQKNIQDLSGGEQRRTAIAALAMQSPRIYLLDEPANHLDIPHQASILHYFSQQCQSHAVIMSTHDINLAAHYCNKILMLFNDGTSLHGTRETMLTGELLTQLYQHPIDAIRVDDQTYWLPSRTKLIEKEAV